MPDFAMRPNPLFIFCELIFLFLPLMLVCNSFCPQNLFWVPSLSLSLCRWLPAAARLLSAVAGVWGGEPSSGATAGRRQCWDQSQLGSLLLQPVHTCWQLPSLQVRNSSLVLNFLDFGLMFYIKINKASSFSSMFLNCCRVYIFFKAVKVYSDNVIFIVWFIFFFNMTRPEFHADRSRK